MEYIPDAVVINNDDNIYIIGIIVIIVCLVCFFMNRGDSLPNIPLNDKVKEILNYSLMVHLDDEVSEKRLNDVKEIYKNYDLPINLFKATHWKNDRKELSKYPLDYNGITNYNNHNNYISGNRYRPGAYGLAGSFYKCLMKAYNENWSYLLFLEDDAVPILPPNQFNQRFNEVITSLPNNGVGIFMLGLTVRCETNKNDKIKWIQIKSKRNSVNGCHACLISKEYIKILFEYIQTNGLNMPIDFFLDDFNPWLWFGDLTENGMFRGLYKQLYLNCSNFISYPGPINSSK